jgi:hypothetical protein
VSSLRLLDARVARRKHEHIFIIRPCQRCGQPFQHCRGCEPGRLYCLACSPLASRERQRRAHETYYDSVEGRQQHHHEEHERRKRRRGETKQKAMEGGRDRRCALPEGRLQVVASASSQAAEEPSGEPIPEHRSVDRTSASGNGSREEPSGEPGREPASVEWTVVAWPGLLAAARRLLGTEVTCPLCGRRGIVKRVLALDQWKPVGSTRGQVRTRPP